MTTNNFKTLHVWDTKFSADSVEWCPISPYKNFFVCGTYFLPENTDENVKSENQSGRQRTGTITLFRVVKDVLESKQSYDCPAVLDMKWSTSKVNGNIALAVANAEGEVCLFYFENGLLNFVEKCLLKEETGDFLTLSLDWIKTDSPDLICSSDSRGNVTLIKVSYDSLQVLKKWKAHSLEAWIVCFDSFNSSNIYSGGDEAEMKVWDYRCEDVTRIASTKHKAGVTALNSNIYVGHNLVSGSYDEIIRFWDTRNWKAPKESIAASGGIWRLKWEPRSRSQLLLSACIYGGFQVYDTSLHSVVGEYREHESLAYGADWCLLDTHELKSLLNCDGSALIATCSFYDHKLCVSSWLEDTDT